MFWMLLLLACKPQPTLATHGGLELVYEVKLDGVPAERQDEAMEQVLDTLRRRVDEAGVAEPAVRRSGSDITVQLVGGHDMDEMHALLGRTARIAFLPAADPETADQVVKALAEGAPAGVTAGLTGPEEALRAHVDTVSDRVPSGLRVVYQDLGDEWGVLVVQDSEMLRGEHISDASVAVDRNTSRPHLSISFDDQGTKALAALTTAHTGEVLAMVVDDEVLSAPVVREPIRGGALILVLGGTGTAEEQTAELQDLAVVLRSGALPSPVELKSVRHVSPAE